MYSPSNAGKSFVLATWGKAKFRYGYALLGFSRAKHSSGSAQYRIGRVWFPKIKHSTGNEEWRTGTA